MADIAALKQAVDAAEAVKEALLVDRRANRDAMSKIAFRAYNEETRDDQVKVQKDIDDAVAALNKALNKVRSDALEVAVGTLESTSTIGGAN